jgi:prepilin-type N-terminal cleavage/methylation domain-containing protein
MPVEGISVRRRRQHGFTLIEMLVVIAILGILAAIATMGMTGLTSAARQRAQNAELMTIQAALTAMTMDQQTDPADACTGSLPGGTNDMAQFPNATDWTRQGTGKAVKLYPHYLHARFMNRAYVCSADGAVRPVGG